MLIESNAIFISRKTTQFILPWSILLGKSSQICISVDKVECLGRNPIGINILLISGMIFHFRGAEGIKTEDIYSLLRRGLHEVFCLGEVSVQGVTGRVKK